MHLKTVACQAINVLTRPDARDACPQYKPKRVNSEHVPYRLNNVNLLMHPARKA